MKNIVIGFVLSLTLITVPFEAYHAWKWKQITNTSAWKARESYGYLSEVIYKDASGKEFTRAQVLDYLIVETVKNAKK